MTAKEKMDDIWDKCEQIGYILALKKVDVFTYLYQQLKKLNMINAILDKDAAVIEIVQTWPKYIKARRSSDNAKRNDDFIAECAKEKPAEEFQSKYQKKEPAETFEDRLKIAMWYVKMVGGIEQARTMLNALQAAYAEGGEK